MPGIGTARASCLLRRDRFIESNRGKLFRAPSPEAEELDEEEEVDEDELSGEDIDLNDLED